jgi:hypothetical protein
MLAGVLHLYRADGSTYSVLSREEIDALAKAIKDGSYPIDIWEDSPRITQAPLWENQTSSQQAKARYPVSRSEMLRDATTLVLDAAQQAFAVPCYLIGSKERGAPDQQQQEPSWEAHLRAGQEEYIYTVKLQQAQFVVSDVTRRS